jgi:hypothetical protein
VTFNKYENNNFLHYDFSFLIAELTILQNLIDA